MPLQVSAAALDQASNKHARDSRAKMSSVCRSALRADFFMHDASAIAFVDAFKQLALSIAQVSQLGACAADLKVSGIIHNMPSRLRPTCVNRDGISTIDRFRAFGPTPIVLQSAKKHLNTRRQRSIKPLRSTNAILNAGRSTNEFVFQADSQILQSFRNTIQ